ncbi:MAG: UDP-glucose 6-dehydrogenase [Archangium gephyra]|uniref:UDP-glucose 6-dehydrogenase n=1 Tax=Archangium gephyra TaxID=48 RepID=A0A2W5TM55_9BACT|nr:MAG: UDP-glucose 6-dehydrogenase [Archangium gephyra]
MRLSVIGCGYVGLVAGACFAEAGHDVVCVDVDAARVESLRRGRAPFHEPGLEPLLRSPRLSFSTEVVAADVTFIAVGTPDGNAEPVLEVARSITSATTLVIKSTVPVGTADRVREIVSCDVVSNPEFLREGSAVDDFRKPDRVIVGTDSERARQVMRTLYPNVPLLFMDTRSAELTKLASNAMLATRISFINEMARVATDTGADIELVRRGVGADRRIGSEFLAPGIGYGGSCLPKDVRALSGSELLRAVDAVNERQKTLLVELARAHFGGTLRGKTFALWGLAFKPGTDDVRESPGVALAEQLRREGAGVRAFDPLVRTPFSAMASLQDADALFIATEAMSGDFAHMKSLMKTPVIFDGRNVYARHEVEAHGFTYFAVGR